MKTLKELKKENTELKELIGEMYEDLLDHQCENASNFFTRFLTITEGQKFEEIAENEENSELAEALEYCNQFNY